jgi:hypothetical protein
MAPHVIGRRFDMDMFYLVLTLVFFLLSGGFVRLCQKV